MIRQREARSPSVEVARSDICGFFSPIVHVSYISVHRPPPALPRALTPPLLFITVYLLHNVYTVMFCKLLIYMN